MGLEIQDENELLTEITRHSMDQRDEVNAIYFLRDDEDEEDVSFNVESPFANILIKETIELICDGNFNHKKLKPICKQPFFKKLLHKLTTECTFSVSGRLH